MAAPATYTATGAKASKAATLDSAIFGLKVTDHELLKRAYVAYLANGRENLAVTKTRGLVSGGGKKPWRQKGTGRARFGSTRNPIWRTGGIVFGPTGEENYTKHLNVKAKRLALRQALSLAATEGKLKVIENFDAGEGKVKPVVALLGKLETQGKVLLVGETKNAEAIRATNNIPNLKLVQATYLNVFDIMNADSIVVSQAALDAVQAWLQSVPAKEAK